MATFLDVAVKRHRLISEEKRKSPMKRLFVGLAIVSVTAFLTNTCTQSPDIETITWEEDGSGYIQFSTNDPDYYGWAFWRSYDAAEQVAPMANPVTGITIKMSGGFLAGGQRIIFCVQDIDNFFYFLIAADGYYSVGECIDGTPTKILDWTFSGTINAGIGASNTLSAAYTSGTNTMAVSVNGSQIDSFQPNTGSSPYIQNWTGGKAGFIVWISTENDEEFPDTPCDVRYQLTSPVAIP
jgi:hypothetical protein